MTFRTIIGIVSANARTRADRRTRANRVRCQAGYTMIEAMLTAALSVIVISAVLAVLESSQRVQAADGEYALALQEGRTGLQRILREVRQAYSVKSASSNAIDFLITLGGSNYEVYYECDVTETGTSYDRCVRVSTTVGGTLPALSTGTTVVPRVLNQTSADPSDPVFSYTPNAISPKFAKVKIVLPAAGSLTGGQERLSHHVILSDGAYIRNLDLGT